MDVKLPILVLAGSLGAGKTTFLNQLRRRSPKLLDVQARGALLLIINDFASENVDAALVSRNATEGTHEDWDAQSALPSVVPISGGCVCCNKLPTLLRALHNAVTANDDKGEDVLLRTRRWEYVILECTGLADTAPVAAAILTHPLLRDAVEIDAIVAVVDASTYTIATDPLMGSQLVGANVLLLTKTDLVKGPWWGDDITTRAEGEVAAWAAATRNPDVVILPSAKGDIAFAPFEEGRRRTTEDPLVGRFLFRNQPTSRALFLEAAVMLADRTDAEREQEEALERQRLGLSTLCYRLWVVDGAGSPQVVEVSRTVTGNASVDVVITRGEGAASQVALSSVLRSIPGIIKGGLRGSRHPAVVWRSKGFLFAVDDVPPMEGDHGAQSGPMCTQQFSWNSQGKVFDYAPVALPHVALPLNSDVRPCLTLSGVAVSEPRCVAELVFIGTMSTEVTIALLDAVFLSP